MPIDKYVATNHGDDISFGFDLYLFQKAYKCYGCADDEEELRNVKVDGAAYAVGTEPSDNFMLVQPNSGYMYQTLRNSTVFMVIGGNKTFAPFQAKVTPFRSLDALYGAVWPLYDFAENLQANEDAFTNKFSYVSDSLHKQSSFVISMSVLCAFFLILGIVAITVYKIKDPKRRTDSREEQLARHEESNLGGGELDSNSDKNGGI